MSRLKNSVLVVFLLAAVIGCGNPTPTTDNTGGQALESTGDDSKVKDDSQPTNESVDSPTGSETAERTESAVTESTTLKSAMIDVTADLMKERQPNTDPDAVRGQVENAIAQIREDVPDFLTVSAETEERLQAGATVEGAAERIAEAEAFFSEHGLQLSGLVGSLLPQHTAGALDSVRTELLAQLIVADMKKAQNALTN